MPCIEKSRKSAPGVPSETSPSETSVPGSKSGPSVASPPNPARSISVRSTSSAPPSTAQPR